MRNETLAFGATLARWCAPSVSAHRIEHAGALLMRHASAHLRACERLCSIPPPPADPEAWYRALATSEAALDRVARSIGLRIETQRDPRGRTAILWRAKRGKRPAAATTIPQRGLPAHA
jgi:hypothetical protein